MASLKLSIKQLNANTINEDSLLAEAESIIANPDAILEKFGYVEEAALTA